uniref:Uncharacterized protein n=1 Tax=Anguilla anguilla TaxID=7936 RepID=A0A0E9QXM0_ANGAN
MDFVTPFHHFNSAFLHNPVCERGTELLNNSCLWYVQEEVKFERSVVFRSPGPR